MVEWIGNNRSRDILSDIGVFARSSVTQVDVCASKIG